MEERCPMFSVVLSQRTTCTPTTKVASLPDSRTDEGEYTASSSFRFTPEVTISYTHCIRAVCASCWQRENLYVPLLGMEDHSQLSNIRIWNITLRRRKLLPLSTHKVYSEFRSVSPPGQWSLLFYVSETCWTKESFELTSVRIRAVPRTLGHKGTSKGDQKYTLTQNISRLFLKDAIQRTLVRTGCLKPP